MAKDAAELASLFGYEVPDEEAPEETPETPVETPETAEDGGEGKGEPRDVAASETPTGEEAPAEPKTEISVDETPDDRYQKLLDELKKYRKYGPLVEMFEEEPALARQLLAQRMGLAAPAEEPAKPAAPAGPTPEQAEEIKAYWARRMQEDPVGGLAEFMRAAMSEELNRRLGPTEQITTKSVVRDFKADLKASDPTFTHREAIFDMLVAKADKDALQKNPEASLQALEVLAFGIWAKQQREAMARAASTKKPATKETPRTLSTSTTETPKDAAKPKRQLTDEERHLAEIYPELSEVLDEEEEESVWGRG